MPHHENEPLPPTKGAGTAGRVVRAPQLRADLVVTDDGGETVTVRRPESNTGFPIYRREWRLAAFLDGTKDLDAITETAQRVGLPATPDLVYSFIRELKGYGFLVEARQGGALHAPQARRALDVVRESAASDEERQLIDAAMVIDDGTADTQVASYLEAVLEINPNNLSARSVLLGRRRSTVPGTDLSDALEVQPVVIESEPESSWLTSPRVVMAAAGLALAILAIGGAVLWSNHRVARALADIEATNRLEPSRVPRTAEADPPPATPAAEKRPLVIDLQLGTGEIAALAAPQPGVWLSATVAVGDVVAPGATIGTWCDAASYRRLTGARRRLAQVQALARKSAVYRDFVAQARAGVERVERDMKHTALTTEHGGRVVSIDGDQGASFVRAKQLASIERYDRRRGTIARGAVPFGVANASCRVEDLPALRCSLRETADAIEVLVEDDSASAKAGNVRIVIEPGGS